MGLTGTTSTHPFPCACVAVETCGQDGEQQERRQQVMYGNYMEPPPQGTAEYGFGGEGEPPGAAGSGGGDAGGGGGDAALGADPGAQ